MLTHTLTLPRPLVPKSRVGPSTGSVRTPRDAAVDRLLGTDLEKQPPRFGVNLRRRMEEIVEPLPTGLLEELAQKGLRIKMKKPTAEASGRGVQVVGQYSPVTRNICFEPHVMFGPGGACTVLHEIWHAVDHLRGDRQSPIGNIPLLRGLRLLTGGAEESSRDAELVKLYHNYLARCNVMEADTVRYELRSRLGARPPENKTYRFTLQDDWGSRKVTYHSAAGVETIRMKHKRNLQEKMATGLIVAVAAIGGPITMATVGATWLGLKLLARASGNLQQTDPKYQVAVPMASGAIAKVTQRNQDVTMQLPAAAEPRAAGEWSMYAYRSGHVEEYAAEAFSAYLVGGRAAKKLQAADPETYDYVAKKVKEEFLRHTA